MEKTLSLRGLFRISRPINLLLIAFTQGMTAHFLIKTNAEGLPVLQDYRLYLLLMATVLVTAAGYMINDYYDVKIDYINRPNTVVVGKGIKRRVILVLHSLFNFIAVGLGWAVAPRIAAVIFFAGVLLWWYCNRLKRKPFIGNVAVAFFDRAFNLLSGLLLPEKRIVRIYLRPICIFLEPDPRAAQGLGGSAWRPIAWLQNPAYCPWLS